jgi:serine/threonine protein kinase
MQPLGVDEPTVVGPYRLLGRLGSGGMGRVYLGRSAGGRTVAVKIVHPHFALDEEFRALPHARIRSRGGTPIAARSTRRVGSAARGRPPSWTPTPRRRCRGSPRRTRRVRH